ncbi:MAG: hypothetical protein AAB797_03460, partial [Patescibacteria group bacterium]
MLKLKNILKWSALSLVFSLLIIFSARAQTASTTDPQTTCTGGGGKWCINSGGSMSGSGYCSYSTSPCPAYDTASCSAQSGEWCAYSGSTGGYCATGGATCPINDGASCAAKGRTWCNYSTPGITAGSMGSGYCANTGEKCPAYDEPSCTAQGSKWCAGVMSGGTSGWCASSTGSTCPSSSGATTTVTPIPTPTYPVSSWPNTESDCTKYKGVWCVSTYTGGYSTMSGSCMTAGQTCPSATPAGKMSCWDGSYVDTYSSCPTTPSTKDDCTTKGYKWCDSSTVSTYSTYSSGWCTGKTQNCPTYPSAGKMSCPDGVTFATTLMECPTAQTTILPTTKTCPDGKVVDASATCPVTYKTCPNGSQVESTVACPEKTDDSVSACLNKKGVWCLDKTGGNGYCAIGGGCKTDLPEEKELVLDAKQTKVVESMKKDYARNLDTLEKTFKRLEDQASLA